MKKKIANAAKKVREAARLAANRLVTERFHYARRRHHRKRAQHFAAIERDKGLPKQRRKLAGDKASHHQTEAARHDALGDQAHHSRKTWEKREERYRKRVHYLKNKRDEAHTPATGVVVPDEVWNPSRRPIASWMVPWIEKSVAAGWRGVIVSAWRDPVYSEGLCYQMCGAPSCSGTCAGRSSNHSGSTYPAGAIDLTDYYTFASVQYRIGSPLRNDLPNDRVHFSVSGH